MYNVLVTLAKVTAPAGTPTVASTTLSVTDAAGAVQKFSLNGSETPPWSGTVSGLADGTSTFSAQDVDASGNPVGSPQTATYTPTAPTTNLVTSSISVVAAP